MLRERQTFDILLALEQKPLDNHGDENRQGVQPEHDATNLARAAHVWKHNRACHGNDSDSGSEASKSDEDDDSDSSSPDQLESSDEDDDWGAQGLEVDNTELPEWQMGLTAGEVLEEDFEGEAIHRGNA